MLSGGRGEMAELPRVKRISPRLPPSSRATASRTDAHIARPSMTPSAIVSIRPSTTIMSAAWRAAVVPWSPRAMPTSASRIAGASLAPSPVTATTCPARRSDRTTATLCAGLTRAKTAALDTSASRSVSSASSRSGPVITAPPLSRSSSAPIASAVLGWSPVSMTTFTPALRSRRTASAAVGRTASASPSRPAQLEPVHPLVVEMLAPRRRSVRRPRVPADPGMPAGPLRPRSPGGDARSRVATARRGARCRIAVARFRARP